MGLQVETRVRIKNIEEQINHLATNHNQNNCEDVFIMCKHLERDIQIERDRMYYSLQCKYPLSFKPLKQ